MNKKRVQRRLTPNMQYRRRFGHCMGRPQWPPLTEMMIRRKHADARFFGWRFKQIRDYAALRRNMLAQIRKWG